MNTEDLASQYPAKVKAALIALLDEVVDSTVYDMYRAFHAAADKKEYIRQLATQPLPFQRLMQYIWIRMELMHVAYMQAAMNKKNLPESSPSTADSIAASIIAGRDSGVTIQQSIKQLERITLEVVSTEHPTCHLSSIARNSLDHLMRVIGHQPVKVEDIKQQLIQLLQSDPVPAKKRTILEEVERTITMSLERLYHCVPAFINIIITAYQTAYPEEFAQYEVAIKKAIDGTSHHPTRPIESPATWPGFDADGHPGMLPSITQEAIKLYRQSICEKHIATLKLIRAINPHSATFTTDINLLIIWFEEYDHQGKLASKKLPEIIQLYENMLAKHHDFLATQPELNSQLYYFGIRLRGFGLSYGHAHIRQDSSVYEKVWDELLVSTSGKLAVIMGGRRYSKLKSSERLQVHEFLQNNHAESTTLLAEIRQQYILRELPQLASTELERIQLALQHDDMINKIIISNTGNAANIHEVRSLLRIFTNTAPHLLIVPLLEQKKHLKSYLEILEADIKQQITNKLNVMLEKCTDDQRPILNLYLETKQFDDLPLWIKKELQFIEYQVMIGFSDTQRISGLPSLIDLQIAQEAIVQLGKKYGIHLTLFHGPGGDIFRGGPARADAIITVQGEDRNHKFANPKSTLHFKERQVSQLFANDGAFTSNEMRTLSPESLAFLNTFATNGSKYYEELYKSNAAATMAAWTEWLVKRFNASSRPSQRGQQDGSLSRPSLNVDLANMRAITKMNTDELLRANAHMITGTGKALRELGLDKAILLYRESATFKDIIEKLRLAIITADYSIVKLAYLDNANEIDDLSSLLSRLEKEYEQTKQFLFTLNKGLFPNGPDTLQTVTDLYYHDQAMQQEMEDRLKEGEAISIAMALTCRQVMQGDCIGKGLPMPTPAENELSFVDRLLGTIYVAMNAFRCPPVAFHVRQTPPLTATVQPLLLNLDTARRRHTYGFESIKRPDNTRVSIMQQLPMPG